MMDMCPAELEKHFMLTYDRIDINPTVRSGIQDCAKQMSDKSEFRTVDVTAHPAEEGCLGNFENVRPVASATGEGKARANEMERKAITHEEDQARGGATENMGATCGEHSSETVCWQGDQDYFP